MGIFTLVLRKSQAAVVQASCWNCQATATWPKCNSWTTLDPVDMASLHPYQQTNLQLPAAPAGKELASWCSTTQREAPVTSQAGMLSSRLHVQIPSSQGPRPIPIFEPESWLKWYHALNGAKMRRLLDPRASPMPQHLASANAFAGLPRNRMHQNAQICKVRAVQSAHGASVTTSVVVA